MKFLGGDPESLCLMVGGVEQRKQKWYISAIITCKLNFTVMLFHNTHKIILIYYNIPILFLLHNLCTVARTVFIKPAKIEIFRFHYVHQKFSYVSIQYPCMASPYVFDSSDN